MRQTGERELLIKQLLMPPGLDQNLKANQEAWENMQVFCEWGYKQSEQEKMSLAPKRGTLEQRLKIQGFSWYVIQPFKKNYNH